MDQAIYQAELAVCGTHLRAIGTGAVTYTADYKRLYPHRFGAGAGGWETITLTLGSRAADDRAAIRRGGPY